MKVEINYKKKIGKFTNMWKLNNMLLTVKEQVKEKLKSTEKSENRNTVYQNLRFMAGVLRGKFIGINIYIKEKKKDLKSVASLYIPRNQNKNKQMKPKISRREDVTKDKWN